MDGRALALGGCAKSLARKFCCTKVSVSVAARPPSIASSPPLTAALQRRLGRSGHDKSRLSR
eukprot:3025556-Prymnesium_polylepis.1